MIYNPHKDNYKNDTFDYITSAYIVEYDIKSAGFNMLISARALTNTQIEYLSSLPKKERNIKIGLLQKDNPELKSILKNQFYKYRSEFIESNNIKDNNIITVKKDAFFLVNAKVTNTIFDNIEFRIKNSYSSYYRLDNFIEIFYNQRDDKIDIKGFTHVKEHEKYMIKFIKKIIKLNEISKESACRYLYKFANDYRKLKLPIGFYREFNEISQFRLKYKFAANSIFINNFEDKEEIDITYNYIHVILPFIKLIY